jgi:hypothetical protein
VHVSFVSKLVVENGLRADRSNEGKPLEIGGIKSQKVREVVHYHRGDQARVVNLLSEDLMLGNQSLPLFENIRSVWQQSKGRFDDRYPLRGFIDREGQAIANLWASSNRPEFDQILRDY